MMNLVHFLLDVRVHFTFSVSRRVLSLKGFSVIPNVFHVLDIILIDRNLETTVRVVFSDRAVIFRDCEIIAAYRMSEFVFLQESHDKTRRSAAEFQQTRSSLF
jgi:hypothetical protein